MVKKRKSLGFGIGAVMLLLAIWVLMTLAEYFISLGMYLFAPGLPIWTVALFIALFTVSDLGLVGLYIYSVYSLIKFKANAVYLALAALGLTAFKLGGGMLALFLGMSPLTQEMTLVVIVGALMVFLFLIAFFFLAVSSKAREVFPEKKRTLFKRDKILIVVIFLALIVFFLLPEDGSVNYPTSAVSAELKAMGIEGVFAPAWDLCLDEIGDETECMEVLYLTCVYELEVELEGAEEFCMAYMDCVQQFNDVLYCDSLYFELEN